MVEPWENGARADGPNPACYPRPSPCPPPSDRARLTRLGPSTTSSRPPGVVRGRRAVGLRAAAANAGFARWPGRSRLGRLTAPSWPAGCARSHRRHLRRRGARGVHLERWSARDACAGRRQGRAGDGRASVRPGRARAGRGPATRGRRATPFRRDRSIRSPLRHGSGRAARRGRLMRVVLFFGAIGPRGARLAAARAVLDGMGKGAPFEIVEIPYPDSRAGPPLRSRGFSSTRAPAPPPLGPRARTCSCTQPASAHLRGRPARAASPRRHPLVLQGPVLWASSGAGCRESREAGLAPRHTACSPGPPSNAVSSAGTSSRPLTRDVTSAFFAGYARCAATADLFGLCRPSCCATSREWPRATPPRSPGSRSGGEARSHRGSRRSCGWTTRAIGVRWSEHTFASWGHYPMIDDAEAGVRALAATATTGPAVRIDR